MRYLLTGIQVLGISLFFMLLATPSQAETPLSQPLGFEINQYHDHVTKIISYFSENRDNLTPKQRKFVDERLNPVCLHSWTTITMYSIIAESMGVGTLIVPASNTIDINDLISFVQDSYGLDKQSAYLALQGYYTAKSSFVHCVGTYEEYTHLK